MNVLARTLSVHNYRSFEEFDVELDPDITILIGRNAVGKTNLIESVQLLTAGQSFRRPTASQLVRNGEVVSIFRLRARDGGSSTRLSVPRERRASFQTANVLRPPGCGAWFQAYCSAPTTSI